MKKLIILVILSTFISCQKPITSNFVIKKFNTKVNSYNKIESKITRIDSSYNGYVMNRNGKVLIEKNENDKLFGMSFYASSSSNKIKYLYDNKRVFEISNEDKSYKTEKGYYGFLGSPGGQLISKNLISVDSIYESVDLIETKNSFKLQYSYKNDTVYNIQKKKTLYIDRQTYLPSKVVITSKRLGEKSSQHFIFENIKIDSEINASIEKYKNDLQEFTINQTEELKRNSQIGKKFNLNSLLNLVDSQPINISTKFPALISFWEVWCSPCIRSLPKIDALQNKYINTINIIGITTENKKSVEKMLSAKKITFLNLIGTHKMHQLYEINSFPTYLLIDKNGVIIKECFSSSDEIEKDIKNLISD